MDSLIDTEGVQAGDREERYFYAGWRVIEERTGGGDVIAQTVWGTEYIDAPICRDRNTKFTNDDCLDEDSRRYFYHQDINFRVTALTDESGEIVERYDYDAYGNARIYSGGAVANSGEGGVLLAVSSVGNPYMHQGLRRDDETGTFENRMRCYNPRIGRFMQRDPAGYVRTVELYGYVGQAPYRFVDSMGLKPDCAIVIIEGGLGAGTQDIADALGSGCDVIKVRTIEELHAVLSDKSYTTLMIVGHGTVAGPIERWFGTCPNPGIEVGKNTKLTPWQVTVLRQRGALDHLKGVWIYACNQNAGTRGAAWQEAFGKGVRVKAHVNDVYPILYATWLNYVCSDNFSAWLKPKSIPKGRSSEELPKNRGWGPDGAEDGRTTPGGPYQFTL